MKILKQIAEVLMSILVGIISIAIIIACLYGCIVLCVNVIQGFATLLTYGEITSQLIIPVIIGGTILGIALFIFEGGLNNE